MSAIEARIVAALRKRFFLLEEAGRCSFAEEVRLLSWGHISDGKPHVMRADFVVTWDDGPLIAIECKGRFEARTDLGKVLSQAGDYARAEVGANAIDKVPPSWVGKPIWAAALAFDYQNSSERSQRAMDEAHRLYGPRNVGFLTVDRWQGLKFTLGADRYWSEEYRWRVGACLRGLRVGSGRKDIPA